MSLYTRLKYALGAFVLLLLGLGLYLGAIQLSGNFAPVVAGEVYRSNQVTAARLARYRDSYGIRTVLNLRGASPGSDWYDEEARAAAHLAAVRRAQLAAEEHADCRHCAVKRARRA